MRRGIEVKIVNTLLGDSIPLPSYATEGAAGMDLRACIDQPLAIAAGETKVVPSGIAVNLHDSNLMGMVVPRSGLGMKHGIVLANLTGIIDSDYHGEIKIGVWNRGGDNYVIEPGERICQLIFVPVVQVDLRIVEDFSAETDRGSGGFGHTGKK